MSEFCLNSSVVISLQLLLCLHDHMVHSLRDILTDLIFPFNLPDPCFKKDTREVGENVILNENI